MAEHPNVALLRRGYEAFAKGDMDAVNELLTDDVIWHVGGNSPLAGDYKGKEQVFGFFAKVMELTGGTFHNDVHDVLANDEHAVALVHSSATREGKGSIGGPVVHVYHVKDGKTTEAWTFVEDQARIDAFYS